MCFNFIQVSVKKLNLNSLKFSVTLYLTNIQKEVFIVSNEICTQLQWSYHCYDDNSNSISISWKKTCQKFFKLLGQSLLIINNEGSGRDCVSIYLCIWSQLRLVGAGPCYHITQASCHQHHNTQIINQACNHTTCMHANSHKYHCK